MRWSRPGNLIMRHGATENWQEHVDGKPQFGPPILPLAPAKFTGALYIVTGHKGCA